MDEKKYLYVVVLWPGVPRMIRWDIVDEDEDNITIARGIAPLSGLKHGTQQATECVKERLFNEDDHALAYDLVTAVRLMSTAVMDAVDRERAKFNATLDTLMSVHNDAISLLKGDGAEE